MVQNNMRDTRSGDPLEDSTGTGLVLVLDCGSTNLRAVAVSASGQIVAEASQLNRDIPDPSGKPGWRVWDLEEIWGKLCGAIRRVLATVESKDFEAVVVTTWGADGAPVRRDGTPTYPPISWQCSRTQNVTSEIVKHLSAWEFFQITGYQVFSFNTLLRLVWLRENVPEALDEAHTWLMMPGLITHRLTDEFHIEPTSASTMMAMDLGRRDWSESVLKLAGLDAGFFPEWSEPGQIVGQITERASKQCGLQEGLPVVVGGHDTQFALIGSGARPGEAVLSSGTWEILEVPVEEFKANRDAFDGGVIMEADVRPHLWNPQLLMLGSAVLEWIREKFFADLESHDYTAMIKEAEDIPSGANGVMLIPSFVRGSGPTLRFNTGGTLLGLSLQSSRGDVYRAALEGLSFQLKEAIEILARATESEAHGIRVVGGGSRNDLWNQIRSDVTNLPVTVTAQKEATVLGSALTAFVGIGRYTSLAEAQSAVRYHERRFLPSAEHSVYQGIFERYRTVPAALQDFYR